MSQRWEDERYVRLYTRDTVNWDMLCWQARALLPQILRKVDRAGLLELGQHGSRGLAKNIKMPLDVIVQPGLDGTEDGPGLLESGTVEIRGTLLVLPNYIPANETPSSDAQRKRDQRERAVAHARLVDLQSPQQSGHAPSREVTNGHSVPSDPCRAVPFENPPASASPTQAALPGVIPADLPAGTMPAPPPSPTRAKPKQSTPKPEKRPGWQLLLDAYSKSWTQLHSTDGKPPIIGGPDVSALARVYDSKGTAETMALIERFVSDSDPHVTRRGHMLRDLPTRLNAYHAKPALRANGPAPVSSYPGQRVITIVPKILPRSSS